MSIACAVSSWNVSGYIFEPAQSQPRPVTLWPSSAVRILRCRDATCRQPRKALARLLPKQAMLARSSFSHLSRRCCTRSSQLSHALQACSNACGDASCHPPWPRPGRKRADGHSRYSCSSQLSQVLQMADGCAVSRSLTSSNGSCAMQLPLNRHASPDQMMPVTCHTSRTCVHVQMLCRCSC